MMLLSNNSSRARSFLRHPSLACFALLLAVGSAPPATAQDPPPMPATALAQGVSPTQSIQPVASTDTATQAVEKGSAQAANGAEPGQPTAPRPAAAASLTILPAPLPPSLTQGINVDARSKEILAHLSEVLRFYRMAVPSIQKVGEPSDILYAEQTKTEATQVAQLAFQAARDEAALLARIQSKNHPGTQQAPAPGESQKLNAARIGAAQRLTALEQQDDDLDRQIAQAHAKQRPPLLDQKADVEGQIELNKAMANALGKVAGVTSAESTSGLQGQINQLQRSAPELVDTKVKPVAGTIESVALTGDAGVSTQAGVLFQLLATERSINQRLQATQVLHDQALELRTPLLKILRATLQVGQNMQAQPGPNPPAGNAVTAPSATAQPVNLATTKERYRELTDAFNAISNVSIPITQEVLLLEQTTANLESWRTAIDAERRTVMRWLLLRVVFIAIALAVILGLNEVARRVISRYVVDIRRRRQFLVIRRVLVTFLSGIVLLFGLVTQFNSLATFAGFITAGIAVGLQTILLSVAAYFFIVGRYGVRVGDRITIAGVTGDVVDVGLVRFYMMELTGTGTELHPTGRVAVFANSILFQAGTPLYKQMPGTEYAWHELTIKLKPDAEYRPATQAVFDAITGVYSEYKARIDQQHRLVESWMDSPVEAPQIESRLQLADGLQYAVLYPVEIRSAAASDEKIVHSVIDAIAKNQAAKDAIDGPPTVRAVIKG